MVIAVVQIHVIVMEPKYCGAAACKQNTNTQNSSHLVHKTHGLHDEAREIGRFGGDGRCWPVEMRNGGLFWAV